MSYYCGRQIGTHVLRVFFPRALLDLLPSACETNGGEVSPKETHEDHRSSMRLPNSTYFAKNMKVEK